MLHNFLAKISIFTGKVLFSFFYFPVAAVSINGLKIGVC